MLCFQRLTLLTNEAESTIDERNSGPAPIGRFGKWKGVNSRDVTARIIHEEVLEVEKSGSRVVR